MRTQGEPERRDVYHIPPNYSTEGTLLGGLVRTRNAAEAAVLALLTGLPLLQLPLGLTGLVIALCLVPLPLAILALVGVDGVSLGEFAVHWFRWFADRRVLRRSDTVEKSASEVVREAVLKEKKHRQVDCTEDLIPVAKIENGILHMKDGRYVKIIEVSPLNFLLRSAREQRKIVADFAAWLKIAPAKIQIKVLSKKADIGRYLQAVERDMAQETNPKCRDLQQDYCRLIRTIGSREAVTRRFLLVMEYEPSVPGRKAEYPEIKSTLETCARTARQFLGRAGNEVPIHEDEDRFLLETLYAIYHREAESAPSLERRIRELAREQDEIPVDRILAPETVDLTHGGYTVIDGVYTAYLLIPTDGYNPKVTAGWTALLVNAGEGIDVDLYFTREPKDQIRTKLGRQIRLNASRILEASDTNTDYDGFAGAIQAGYYLKRGLAGGEDFFYASLLVTVTAGTLDNLQWRIAEVRRHLRAQDMDIRLCRFRQEAALTAAQPFCRMDKSLQAVSRRNMLTSGAAACYPFVSYEMSDENGILLGVNTYNNSLVIVDIFNSRVYKNANMAVLGTSGAGKTFTLQLMALRMRRRGIQVFILAPLKGHEFYRACANIGGAFITIGPASRQCINVMEIRPADTAANDRIDGGHRDNSVLARKIQSLHTFFSLLIPDMSHEERQLLDEALIRTYREKGITHENASLEDPQHPGQYKTMPVLGDLHAILSASPDTKRLANILNRLVHGSARTFNQQTNVDLSNPYTVLDISELTGDLRTAGMYVALDYVWDKAREDRTKEKAIILDEVWQLIGSASNTMAAEFVLEIFKIIRGYGGAAIAATQDIGDFMALEDGRYGKGILNNAKTKIILNLEDDEAAKVQDTLRLTDTEIDNIVRFERGQGLISTNSNHVTVEFKASDLEKRLITTDRYDLQQLSQEACDEKES